MHGPDLRPRFPLWLSGAALAALMAGAAPAAAQQQMTWHAVESDEGGAIIFGVPETDNVTIFFLCTRGAEDIIVQPMTGTKGLKKDDAARAILYAGKLKKIFTGKAVTNEDNAAVNVEAKGKMADLKALVKAGPQLTIETKGVKQKVTLDGADAAFTQFEAACKPR